MSDFLNIILPVAVVVGVAYLLRKMGHSGGRETLSGKYRTSYYPKTACCSGHVFFTKDGDKWIPEGISGFACDDTGFYLIQPRLLGFALPTLCIPWGDIAPNGSVRLWLRSYLELKIGTDNSVLVLVPKNCEELIRAKLKTTMTN